MMKDKRIQKNSKITFSPFYILDSGVILIILFFLILTQLAFPQDKNYGLLLPGKSNKSLSKIEVNLSNDSPVLIRKSASVSFEFSIWDANSYGDLFRANSNNKFFISLTYVQHLNKDTSYIILSINHNQSSVRFPVAKSSLYRNRWYKIQTDIDIDQSKITVSFNNRTAAEYCRDIPKELLLNISAGAESFVTDTPQMALRDFIVTSNKKVLRNWKFDEVSGDRVYDYAGGTYGRVKNGEWLLSRHLKWEKAAELNFDTNEFWSVAFDSAGQRLLFTGKQNLYEYSIKDNTVRKISYNKMRPSTADGSIFNPVTKKLNNYYGGQGQVSIYDELAKKWTKIDTTKDFEAHYYLHANFIDPANGNLYMFGGYGWYKCKNDLQKYDFENMAWQRIPLKGDYIYPREFPSISGANENGNHYIFGGIGNKTGNQDMGLSEINDLFELNLKNYTVRKLYTLQGFKFNRLLVTQMVYSPKGRCLYGVAFDNHCVAENKFNPEKVILFRLSTDKPEIEILNAFSSREIDFSLSSLFYNQKTEELFLISGIENHNNHAVKNIYRMQFPPLNKSKIMPYADRSATKTNWLIYYVTPAAFVMIAITIFYARKRKNRADTLHIGKMVSGPSPYKIRLFGDFMVLNKDGRDISSHFKPKVRQLFLLILMNTYSGTYKVKGITSEKLTAVLWPESDIIQAKNNRNSSIARLRSIASEISDVEIVHEDSLWLLKCEKDLVCDYFDFLKIKDLLSGRESINGEQIDSFINIVSSGVLLQDVSYEWLDSIKASVENEIKNITERLCEIYNQNIEKLVKLSDVLLLWDPVDETGLRIKIRALLQLGRVVEARNVFEMFSERYKEITAYDYKMKADEYFNSIR